jgi:hypothetical protein
MEKRAAEMRSGGSRPETNDKSTKCKTKKPEEQGLAVVSSESVEKLRIGDDPSPMDTN